MAPNTSPAEFNGPGLPCCKQLGSSIVPVLPVPAPAAPPSVVPAPTSQPPSATFSRQPAAASANQSKNIEQLRGTAGSIVQSEVLCRSVADDDVGPRGLPSDRFVTAWASLIGGREAVGGIETVGELQSLPPVFRRDRLGFRFSATPQAQRCSQDTDGVKQAKNNKRGSSHDLGGTG